MNNIYWCLYIVLSAVISSALLSVSQEVDPSLRGTGMFMKTFIFLIAIIFWFVILTYHLSRRIWRYALHK